jgi:hypothetical protein
LTTYTSRTGGSVFINKQPGITMATVRSTVIGPGNSLSFTLVLKKENEQWKGGSIHRSLTGRNQFHSSYEEGESLLEGGQDLSYPIVTNQ